MIENRVFKLSRWLLLSCLALGAVANTAQTVGISITATPRAMEVPVGEVAETFFDWHLTADDESSNTFLFEIITDNDEIEIDPTEGEVSVDQAVRVILKHQCTRAHRRIVSLTIVVADLTRVLPWSIICAGPDIRLTPPRLATAVQGQAADTIVRWQYIPVGSEAETLRFEISSDQVGFQAIPAAGSVAPRERVNTRLELVCERVGVFDMTINLKVGPVLTNFTWSVECLEPKFRIEVNTWPNERYVQRVGEYVIGHLSWQAVALDGSDVEVDYRVRAATVGLLYTRAIGHIVSEESVQNRFVYLCRTRGHHTLNLRVEVANSVRNIQWQVTCLGEDLEKLTISFYQGPLIAQVHANWVEGAWRSRVVSETYHRDQTLWLNADRSTFMSVETQHHNRIPIPLSLTLRGDEEFNVEAELLKVSTNPIKSAQIPSNFESQFTFYLGEIDLQQVKEFHIGIDLEDQLPETNEDNNLVVLSNQNLAVKQAPNFKFVFVPLITQAGEPDLTELDAYLNPILDLMPIGDFEYRIREPLDLSSHRWTRETARAVLTELFDVWVAEGTSREFFQGIVSVPANATSDNAICGLATLNGNTAVTMAMNELCSKESIAHEFGHNLSLRHAPACGADTQVDANYPYTDGSIGIETGWIMSQPSFVGPETLAEFRYADIMSFCTISFTSQYSYGKALLHWQERELEAPVAAGSLALNSQQPSSSSSWVVSGDVSPEGSWSVRQLRHLSQRPRILNVQTETGFELMVLETSTGQQLHREPLSTYPIAHSATGEQLWGAKIPALRDVDAYLVVRDKDGATLVEVDLPRVRPVD